MEFAAVIDWQRGGVGRAERFVHGLASSGLGDLTAPLRAPRPVRRRGSSSGSRSSDGRSGAFALTAGLSYRPRGRFSLTTDQVSLVDAGMQANGADDAGRDAGTPGGEPLRSNGLLSGAAADGDGLSPGTGTGGSATPAPPGSGSIKKKKRLTQWDEDLVRLIGQHLHGLGLK